MAARGVSYLANLPKELVEIVIGSLEPEHLAALCVQNKYLNEEASRCETWERACHERWPHAEELYDSAKRMYATRVVLPPDFLQHADDFCRAAAAGTATSSVSSMTTAAKSVYAIFLAGTRAQPLRRTVEYKLVRERLVELINSTPNMFVRWVRAVHASAIDDDTCGAWARFGWQRSAMQFMLEAARAGGVHESVINRIDAELRQFDYTLRDLQGELGEARLAGGQAAAGAPPSHWWFAREPLHA